MRWTRKSIVEEIRTLHANGDELNYSSAEEDNLGLVQAAAWHFGTWRRAVETAGFDYESVSKYRRWTTERVLEAIREHHRRGSDLSWRIFSQEIDPPLAAAAVRSNVGFDTWHEAITAAGIDYEKVARYRHWTPERVVKEIQELAAQGAPLSSKLVQNNHPPLYNAAKRRFKQWDLALTAAGIDPEKVRQRLNKTPKAPHRRRKNENGEYTFDHVERLEKIKQERKSRRQPSKSVFPVPSKPEGEVPPPPKVEALPLRRKSRKTGKSTLVGERREVYKKLEKEAQQRAKMLAKAAEKKGRKPEKSGHARRRELLELQKQQQLQLELAE